jgi:hypothetical protein
MSDQQSGGAHKTLVISAVEADGTIIETVFRPETATTALLVARGTDIRILPEFASESDTFVPVRASNNLVRHGALLFPSEPVDYESTEALALEIERHITEYVSLSPQAARLCAAYVLLSWVYDAFSELPYLRFRGDYGTGKTRALLVVGSICYRGFFASGASTVSPIFHTLDTFRATLIFDEADFRFSDEKAELVKILNNGNSRGFPVLRTQVSQKREFDPQAFVIYGPKIVGMRRSYDDRALESRFLTIEMEPGRSAGKPINLPDGQKEEALRLRNKLLMFRLRTRLTTVCDPSLADDRLEPRMNQILLPLMTVAPEALRFAIRDMGRSLQKGILAERSTSAEGHVVSIIADLQAERPVEHLALGDIATAFALRYGAEYERPIGNRWVGGLLRRVGITTYKSNGIQVLVPGQEGRIAALRDRYGVAGGELLSEAPEGLPF